MAGDLVRWFRTYCSVIAGARQYIPFNMSDNAESPTETSKDEPSTAPSSAENSGTNEEKKKIDILLKAVGDTPIMKTKKWAVEKGRTVQSLSTFISRFLKLEPSEQLGAGSPSTLVDLSRIILVFINAVIFVQFIYVNQSFAPSPDQEVGVLFECFGSDGKLVLHYCKSQAWG